MPILTILVEDSETIRDALIPTMAELADVQVIASVDTAKDAITALNHYDSSWQLAVVDLFLKEGTGLAVLRACQNRRQNQHVIMLTNFATKEIRLACAELGANAVFDKSTEQEAFLEKCRSYGA